MATASKGRVVMGGLAVSKPEHERMLKNISSDPELIHVAQYSKRATWLRAAIAEKCEKQEREQAGK